jgi:predicted transcriptional regulator
VVEMALRGDLKLRDIRALKVLAFIHKCPGSSIHEVAEGLGFSYKTAQRYLRELRGSGKLIVKLEGMRNIQRFYPNEDGNYEFLSKFERTVKRILER